MLVSFLFLLFLCKSKEKIKIIFKSLICKLQGFFFLKYFFNTDYIKCIQNISQIFISLSGNHSKQIGTQEKGRKLYFCRHLAFRFNLPNEFKGHKIQVQLLQQLIFNYSSTSRKHQWSRISIGLKLFYSNIAASDFQMQS